MLTIPCPYCGPRNEDEFVCWSEAVSRPADPTAFSDAEWTEYVYNHDNPKGWVREQWWHEHGCRRWIVVERNTVTHEVAGAEARVPRKDPSATWDPVIPSGVAGPRP